MANSPELLVHRLRALLDPARQETAPDGELLRRWAVERDARAFAALVWRHGIVVWRVARGVLKQSEDAEDVFQAAFFVLARKAGKLQNRGSVAGWLHETAHRLALKARAAYTRRLRREGQMEQQAAVDPLEEISVREARAILDEELQRLPAKDRDALLLCLYEGATQDQAARQLGCSLSTLKRRLERGRALLAELLSQRGLAPGTALAVTLCSTSKAPALLVQQTVVAIERLAIGQALTGSAVAMAEAMLRTWVLKKVVVAVAVAFTISGLTAAGLALAPIGQGTTAKDSSGKHVYQSKAQPQPDPLPKELPPRLDRFGDPLPPGAVNRLGSIRLRPGSTVFRLAYTPDGKAIASMSNDSFVRLWDAKTGKMLWLWGFAKDNNFEPAMAISGDGKKLAVSTAYDYTLLATDTGKGLAQHQWSKDNEDAIVVRVAIAPDLNTVLRVFRDGTARLSDAATGEEKLRLKLADKDTPTAIAFSADGKMVALMGFQTPGAMVFDTANGKLLHRLQAANGWASQVAFSADQKLLAAIIRENRPGDPARLVVWDLTTGKQRHLIEHWAISCIFSPNSRLVAFGGSDIVLVDTATGKEQRRLPAVPNVISLAFAPKGETLASSDHSGCIALWDVATGLQVAPSPEPSGYLYNLRFQAGGKQLLSLGSDICWWDVTSGERLRKLANNGGRSFGQSVSPDGKLLATNLLELDGSRDLILSSNLILVDTATGQTVRTLTGHKEKTIIYSTVFSPDGTKLFSAGGFDPRIIVWDVAAGKLLRELQSHLAMVDHVAVSPDGCWLASWTSDASAKGDYDIRLWDVGTGKLVHRMTPRRGSAFKIVFSADCSRLVSVGGEPGRSNVSGEVQLWDVATGSEVRSFVGHQERVLCAALTADGRMLATGSLDKTLRFWEVATGSERRRIGGHADTIRAMDFSPNGRLLAAASTDAPILIWDAYALEKPAPGVGKLTKAQRETLWQRLAAPDATAAFEAVCALIARPGEAAAILHDGWKQSPRTPAKQIQQWIQDLDSDQFAVRKKATTELERSVTGHEDVLKKALEQAATLEVRQRLENILDRPNPERLRRTRMLEVLEQVATAEARELLQTLAVQIDDPQLATDAAAGLRRVRKH